MKAHVCGSLCESTSNSGSVHAQSLYYSIYQNSRESCSLFYLAKIIKALWGCQISMKGIQIRYDWTDVKISLECSLCVYDDHQF